MARARVAWIVGAVLTLSGAAAMAYLSLVLLTRPLHSGITPDIWAAIVYMLPTLAAGPAFRVLWRRWRKDYLGHQATVTRVFPGSMARVWVEGVPYSAFIREPVRRGDRVILKSLDWQGAPIRADFAAEKTGASGSAPSGGAT